MSKIASFDAAANVHCGGCSQKINLFSWFTDVVEPSGARWQISKCECA